MLYKKAGIPERKYMSHSTADCTGQRTNWTVKDVIGVSVGSRYYTVKQYKKSEKKLKKELKALEK